MLKYSFVILLITFHLFAANSVSASEPDIYGSDSYYLIAQDNPAFAKTDVVRDKWEKHKFNGLPRYDKIVWVQTDFDLPKSYKQPLGVIVSVLGSFDAYWDGEFIGSNGVVGNTKSSEVPGVIDKIILLPMHLVGEGEHTLSLRISSQHNKSELPYSSFSTLITNYEVLLQLPYKRASLPLIMTSALVLFAVYALVIYFTSHPRASYLIFSALCFSILLLIFAESWRGLNPYTYDWQIPRLQIVLVLSCIISLLFSSFFAWFFEQTNLSRIRWLTIALVGQAFVLLMVDGYDNRSLYVFLIGIVCAGGFCIQAIMQKQDNAKLMLGGLLLFTAPIFINSYSYMDQYFFLSFSALIGMMLYILAKNMSNKQQELSDSKITAARLELELVKRNLQPHFILNTLTAVEEWIEESPQTAVNFIQALADEFRCMAALSAQSIVMLKDEIQLCNSHLEVMSYRTNTRFSMVTKVENINTSIPPGIILTLIENAMSHNKYVEGKIEFTLEQSIKNGTQTISFFAPVIEALSNKRHLANKNNSTNNGINLGIGGQYIRARLSESFGKQWQINEVLNNDIWEVKIQMLIKGNNMVDATLSGSPKAKHLRETTW